MERITKGKANKAAWPGSQPLFDALRHGIDEFENKTKELSNARDMVKNAHIAVDKSAWDDACGCILAHWTSALKTHRSIFQEVVNVTKPSPGVEANALFIGFSELLETANASIENADDVRKSMHVKAGIHTSNSSRESDTFSKSESAEFPDVPEIVHSASKKRKVEHDGETTSLPLRSPNKPTKADMAPPRFPGQKERKSSTEDITGLVDARLKADEAKRKEKKDRRKRKRESIASSILSPTDSENGDSFTKKNVEPAKASSKELPPKKRAKLEAGAGSEGGKVEVPRANDKSAKKVEKKLKEERAAHGNSAEEQSNPIPSVFKDDEGAGFNLQREAVDKEEDVKVKKEKKPKRRRSSDGLGDEAHVQAQDRIHLPGHGKKTKRVKTG